jgi:hypothetical protein
VVLGMGSQCRVAARLLREWLESVSSGRAPWGRHSNLWPSRVKIFAQLLAPGAASLHITPPQEAAQLPAAAAAALRRHVADFPRPRGGCCRPAPGATCRLATGANPSPRYRNWTTSSHGRSSRILISAREAVGSPPRSRGEPFVHPGFKRPRRCPPPPTARQAGGRAPGPSLRCVRPQSRRPPVRTPAAASAVWRSRCRRGSRTRP